jgi:hypothetical protein
MRWFIVMIPFYRNRQKISDREVVNYFFGDLPQILRGEVDVPELSERSFFVHNDHWQVRLLTHPDNFENLERYLKVSYHQLE